MKKRLQRDKFDSQNYGFFWTFYNLPGRVILWLFAMNPPKGEVFLSKRRANSPIYTFLTSTVFWALIIWIVWAILNEEIL